jgi:hypothetical protein
MVNGPDMDTDSPPPEPAQRGRYAIYEQADGGLVIPRSTGLCERCAACGCGEQAEPLHVPGALVKMAQSAAGGKGGIMGKLKAMRMI